jgi:hypothetical protein
VYPDPRRRARALCAFFTATVRDGIPFGSTLAAWGGPLVAATAARLPPGAFPRSTRRKLAAALDYAAGSSSLCASPDARTKDRCGD